MPWLLVFPGHQQPWYWQWSLNWTLPSTRKDFNGLCLYYVEKWKKMQNIILRISMIRVKVSWGKVVSLISLQQHLIHHWVDGVYGLVKHLHSLMGYWFDGLTHCPLGGATLIISIFSAIDLMWMVQDSTDDKSTLVQVMAWCRQAPSHYLSQCWPRSLSSYGVTRPQCVN